MKKKIIIALIMLMTIIGSVIIFIIYRNNQNIRAEERYLEIKESVKKAVEWNISAQYPGCTISKEFKETTSPAPFYNAEFLINNGYIKKDELLDVDNKSYCDVYVDINTYFKDKLDHQHNCEIYYKIYLKCNNYEDKGYINWGYY